MEERDRAGLRALQDCEGGERNQERASEREIIKADTLCIFIDGEKGLNVDSLYGAFSAGMS